jgi:Trp operon repressor
MEEEINKKLFNYERLFNEELKDAYNFLLDIMDNLLDINDYILDLWISIKELCDQIKNINCAIRDIKQTKGLKEEKLEHNLNPLSNLFEEEEDPIKQKQKRAAEIYEELKNEFHENENLLNEKEIINQLLENDLNKNEIKKSLNSKILQIQENQKNEKAKQLYKELSFYDYNHDFNENEVIALIKEENFNKENVQKCINEKIAEKIYNIISKLDEVDITKNNPKEVKKKIIGLNFNIDKIKEAFKKIIIEDNSYINPDLNHNNDEIDDDNKNHYIYGYDDEEEANKFFEELEDEFGTCCCNINDSFKEKFIELNLNKDQLLDWIQNNYFDL